uniref:(California timema) hypothetical protein n=1 Tax=Timema californicum TaxID=61474 RepID=A0A7R9J2I9_TIMCA|nr:unnamed protein product [Timema californicum]
MVRTQAFAWFSDLLVEHAEIFWSLFAVDMNQVLAEQPPDTWDSFPLFQILNDYLRTDEMAVQLQKTCSGNWMPYSLSFEIFTGLMLSSGNI